MEAEETKKVVQRYLPAYKVELHKTTFKGPSEIMFTRKRMTKLPKLSRKVNKEMVKEVRQKHDREKKKQHSS